jgi:hypothetical protein
MPTAVSLADGAALPSVDDTLPSKIKSIFEDPLSKAFFPDGVVTEKDVRSAFGNVTLNMTDDELGEWVKQVSDVKSDVVSWGKQRVRELLVEHSKEFLHGIMTFQQLGAYWKENGTEDAAAILWQTCYGSFDFKINWELDLEREYMSLRGYSYVDTGKTPVKGCVARSLALRKSEAIKILNKKSDSSHKGTIYMSRKNVASQNGKKFAKRKKGTTIGPHATIGETDYFEVEKEIKRLRDDGPHVSKTLFGTCQQTSYSPIFKCWSPSPAKVKPDSKEESSNRHSPRLRKKSSSPSSPIRKKKNPCSPTQQARSPSFSSDHSDTQTESSAGITYENKGPRVSRTFEQKENSKEVSVLFNYSLEIPCIVLTCVFFATERLKA